MADSYMAETMAFLEYASDLGKKVGEAGDTFNNAATEAAPFPGPGLGTGGARDFKSLYAQSVRANTAFFGEASTGTGLLGSGAVSIGINYANGDTDMSTHMQQAMTTLFNPPAGTPTVRTMAKPATSDGTDTGPGARPGQPGATVPGTTAPGTSPAGANTGSGSPAPMTSYVQQASTSQRAALDQRTLFLTGQRPSVSGMPVVPDPRAPGAQATGTVNQAAYTAVQSQTKKSDDWQGSGQQPYAPRDLEREGKPVVTQFDDPANQKVPRSETMPGPLPQ